jgi:hypothetical protein
MQTSHKASCVTDSVRTMFFIVGTGRCGTKMLRTMLIKHPGIKCMIETHFYPVLLDTFGKEAVSFRDFFAVASEHLSSKRERWIDVVADYEKKSANEVDEFFQQERASNEVRTIAGHADVLASFLYGRGDYVLGDKTPHYGLHATELETIFPQCRFIHLKRNGVFAARSMLSHPGFVKNINGMQPMTQIVRSHYGGRLSGFSDVPVTLEKAAHFWEKLVLATEQELAKIDNKRVLEVYYERLLSEPRMTLARIAQFLGVNSDMEWLDKAAAIPRPLSLRKMAGELSREEYADAFEMMVPTIKQYGYTAIDYDLYKSDDPRLSDIVRIPRQWIKDILRRVRKGVGLGLAKQSRFGEVFKR